MTWANYGYMIFGVLVWHLSVMIGKISVDIYSRWRRRRLKKHFELVKRGFAKIDILADESTTWLKEFRDFWGEFGDAADKMWQPAPAYVVYDSPIEHIGKRY